LSGTRQDQDEINKKNFSQDKIRKKNFGEDKIKKNLDLGTTLISLLTTRKSNTA
jgi:hypothetical protein